MRTIEWLLIAVVLALLAGRLIPRLRGDRRLALLPFVALLLLILHVTLEGTRWQMLPLYIVSGLAFALTSSLLAIRAEVGLLKSLATAGTVVGILLVVLSGVAGFLVPVKEIREPQGSYAIGTATYHWLDESRVEAYGPSPGGPRELMVQVWYPAGSVDGLEAQPWIENQVTGPEIAAWAGMPRFMLGHLGLTLTHAYEDAPVTHTDQPLPVIIYVHGRGGFRDINQDQLEALASHGYVVVSADHTYGALVTVLPGERVAYYDPATVPEEHPADEYRRATTQFVDTYAADTIFVLDQLETLNAQGPLAGRLDLERVGLFGHSTGGGAIVQVCATDPRCKAALGQDVWIAPVPDEIVAQSFQQPLMVVNSATWSGDDNYDRLREFFLRSENHHYWLTISATNHYDFTLVSDLSPIARWIGYKGDLDADVAQEINAAYLLAFFDAFLKDGSPDLLSAFVDYAPVSYEGHPPQ